MFLSMEIGVQDLWQSQSQAHAWGDENTDVAKNVAEVALQESSFQPASVDVDVPASLPFHDAEAFAAPTNLSFQDTAAEDAGDEDIDNGETPEISCACDPCFVHSSYSVFVSNDA